MNYQPLKWTRMQSGTLNGKIGNLTLVTVAYHTGDRRFFVSSKMPGGRTFPVNSETEGIHVAENVYSKFVALIVGVAQPKGAI